MASRMIPSDFVKNLSRNGIGRYVCQLQRVTIKFCKEHGGSRHVRDYIENHLLDFARTNPGTVVYLKPRRHRTPKAVAEYLNGETQHINLQKMDKDVIAKWMDHLRTRSGVTIVRLRKPWHTDNPSIQGVWHPLLNPHPKLNVTDFPSEELSRCSVKPMTATDLLLRRKELGVHSVGTGKELPDT